jgi:iron complex transport system permease protein
MKSSPYSLYQEKQKQRYLILFMLILLLVFVAIVSVFTGNYHLTFFESIRALFKVTDNTSHDVLIWQMRLPKTIIAIIAGAGLSISGCIMQTCLKNDLASPSTLGITSAATFGANLSIILLSTSALSISIFKSLTYLTSLFAFLFSIVVVLIILSLSKLKSFTSQTIVLAGIAMNSLFQAFTTMIQYFANQVTLSAAIFWTFGDLSRGNWQEIIILFIIIIPIFIFFIMKSWDYNSLSSGEDLATSLGVKVNRLKFVSILFAALITSVCVSFLGMISFIGLLAPHISKKIFGKNHSILIPASAITGSVILVLADILSRTIIKPIVLPVGAITSLIGASLFLYLLIKGSKKHENGR